MICFCKMPLAKAEKPFLLKTEQFKKELIPKFHQYDIHHLCGKEKRQRKKEMNWEVYNAKLCS